MTLSKAADHAREFLDSLDSRSIAPIANVSDLRSALFKPLNDAGLPADEVIDDLVRDTRDGLLGSTSGRFFGWVIGGVLPVTLAADWLTSAWDQNAAIYATSPAAAAVEEVCGEWLKSLLGLPASASFGLLTGTQSAHTVALAAARNKLLIERGWDVNTKGLMGAPRMRILTGAHRHESVLRSIRLLGLGTEALEIVDVDASGRIRLDSLKVALQAGENEPAVVCLQAGDLNAGVFDPFTEAGRIAHDAGAWVHVDGAFGLWAGASEHNRYLVEGVGAADSWATDCHKWLNVPFDSGFVFVADPEAHKSALTQDASYTIKVEETRDQMEWNLEWSRRSRGFTVYAALRNLGRSGVAELVERCCGHAHRLVTEIGDLDGAHVLAEPQINQGLVQFTSNEGNHDRRTDEVIAKIVASGEAWFGGTTWNGIRAMRVSVCNWRTTDEDVDRAIACVRGILAGV
ncbi:MAG: aspartate aminotransferase family protein [Candidatus Latescibacteria bacterium]|nr:aspartate aminotransferase family protein [Candidatus Latescibacterota bacterium]